MKFIALIVLVSCANVKEITNLNSSQFTTTNWSRESKDVLHAKVKTIDEYKSQTCQLIGDLEGRDNFVDYGEEVAVINLKYQANQKNANAVVLGKKSKRGQYGTNILGKAYKCE